MSDDLHILSQALCGDPKHRIVGVTLGIDEHMVRFCVQCHGEDGFIYVPLEYSYTGFIAALREIKYMTPTPAWRLFILMFYQLPQVNLYLTETHSTNELLGLDSR